MTAPDRIWIEDERPEGGQCHVHNVPSEGVLLYGVEYVRADLARASLAEALAVPTDDTQLLLDAYKGMLVLHRMLDKVGLTAGVKATNSLTDRIVAAHPEFPALAALRAIGEGRADG